MNFKIFGIYTGPNYVYIIMESKFALIKGIKIPFEDINVDLTNDNINKWLLFNISNFTESNYFEIMDPEIIFVNAGYLGQIYIGAQDFVNEEYERIIREKNTYF